MRTPLRHVLMTALLLLACAAQAQKLIPVLCLAARDTRAQGLTSIAPAALTVYRDAGFALQFDYYENATPELLRRFPVVVGMLAQLHQGTSVFNGSFGQALDTYVREGGSFLFFSGPSYYGTADFADMQNPFLSRYGITLLKEVPRHAAEERTLSRILGYRYLRTTDISETPYWGRLDELFLPLDFTDAYIRTHTAKLSPGWTVLVSAGEQVASYPHAAWLKGIQQPGHWTSRPPILALRTVDKGRFALFTTASEYFVWEATHWAFGDGFVLHHGGLRLMTGLLRHLADHAPLDNAPATAVAQEEPAPKVMGEEVPVCTTKNAWYRHVLNHLLPAGWGVCSRIDCGALADLPYTPDRGRGCLDAAAGELIRAPGKEMFHATACNARGIGQTPVIYRFSNLNGARRYKLGLLLWSMDPGIGRDLDVTINHTTHTYPLPRFDREQGPRFITLGPFDLGTNTTCDVRFARGTQGSGHFSAINELWLFVDQPCRETATAEQLAETFDSLHEGAALRFPNAPLWKGLIGAQSPAAGGVPVDELAQAARTSGFSFLAYTDPIEKHTQTSFAALQAACAHASSSTCAVYAGLCFTDRYTDRPAWRAASGQGGSIRGYVFQPLKTLPSTNDFGMPSALYWKFFGGAYSGGQAAVPTLTHPGKNGISPWHQRFWRGFDVMTLHADGTILDDARNLYADLLASGYGPQPRVSGIYRTPQAITAGARNWIALSAAPSPAAVATHPHAMHVTSGPLIRAFQIADDHYNHYGVGGGLLFQEPSWMMLHLDVAHTCALTRVTLFANQTIIRQWTPQTNIFTVTEPIRIQTAAEYRLQVTASDHSEALSGRFQVAARPFATSLCADNQNTITTVFNPPSRYAFDERELYLQFAYWHTGEAAGQLGALCDATQLVPRVDETGIIQPCKYFHPCPTIEGQKRTREDHQHAILRIEESSPEVARISYTFCATQALFHSRTVLTSYQPLKGGPTTVFVETELCAQQAIRKEDYARITLIDVALRPDLSADWQFTLRSGSSEERLSGSCTHLVKAPVEGAFDAQSFAGFWPHEIGNLFVASCDDLHKRIAFSTNPQGKIARERMTVFLPARDFAAGERLISKHLVCLVPDIGKTADALTRLHARLLTPFTQATLTQGTLCQTMPYMACQADGFAVSGWLDPRLAEHHPIPFTVHGLNPAWPILRKDISGIHLLRANRSTLYSVVAAEKGRTAFTFGNALLADPADLRMELESLSAHRMRFIVHNPRADAQTYHIRTNPAIPDLPRFHKTIGLAPGETRWFSDADTDPQ